MKWVTAVLSKWEEVEPNRRKIRYKRKQRTSLEMVGMVEMVINEDQKCLKVTSPGHTRTTKPKVKKRTSVTTRNA